MLFYKYLFLIFIFSIFSLVTSAQRFRSGMQLSLVGSQVDGDGASGYNKIGLNAGIFVNTKTSEKTSVQLELNYIQKGSRQNPTQNNNFSELKIRLSYIELPLVLRKHFSGRLKNFTIETGFAYAVLMKQYSEFQYLVNDEKPFLKQDISSILGFNYQITERINLNFRSENSMFFSPIRYFDSSHTRWLLKWGYYNVVLLGTIQYIIK